MPDTVTILIPDISGYTEFLSKTDVEHGAHIINHLLDRIVESMDSSFTVSEIEGDAVLLYRKGSPPSKREIIEQCTKTFLSFQTDIHNIKDIVICQCSACHDVTNLTLKFVVHYGSIAEISVNRFVKASGIDMVIAHRLLKNSIPSHEYLLTTNSYLKNISDADESHNLTWVAAEDDYPSIGIIEYRFASLSPLKNALHASEGKKEAIIPATGISATVEINVPFKAVPEIIINLEKRKQYVEGLPEGEGPPRLVMGVRYSYLFEKGKAEIEPRKVASSEDEWIYEEFITFQAIDLYAACQFHAKALGANRCRFTAIVFPQPGHTFSDEMQKWMADKMKAVAMQLKVFSEKDFQLTSVVNS